MHSHVPRGDRKITEVISRLREKVAKCDFGQTKLSERLIEMVILSAPITEFKKELLAKPKGFQTTDHRHSCCPNQVQG